MNVHSMLDKFTDVHLPSHMGRSLETYAMHDVITAGSNKQKTYRGTVSFCGWCCFICLCISAYFGYNYNLIGTLFPLPFFIIFFWSYLLFKRLSSNLVFDYVNGTYYGCNGIDEAEINPIKQGSLKEIKQLLITKKRNSGHYDDDSNTRGRDFNSYRLEMDLLDGSKRLIMHRMHFGNSVFVTAAHLAERIGVPAYDANGLVQVSEQELRKHKPTKSLRLSIDDQEQDKHKNTNWPSIILVAALLAGGGYIAYNKYTKSDTGPHVSETLHPQVLENYIKKFYSTRFDGDFIMTDIDKILIVPVDEKHFDLYVRYQFAPSRPESGIGYFGSDQRIFKARINSYDANSASISILSMGKNNSADFVLGELKKSLK